MKSTLLFSVLHSIVQTVMLLRFVQVQPVQSFSHYWRVLAEPSPFPIKALKLKYRSTTTLRYASISSKDSSFGNTFLNAPPACHYIFGYGSLMCAHSRAITAPETKLAVPIPVLVDGIETVWAKRSKIGMTAVGIRRNENASSIGIILPIDEIDLAKFDNREKGYTRIFLDIENVNLVPFLTAERYAAKSHDVLLNAKDQKKDEFVRIWTYMPEIFAPANAEYPIVQSYVDTILRGCLDTGGEEFADEFIRRTKGWDPEELSDPFNADSNAEVSAQSTFWVEDRGDPVYTRGDPFHSQSNAETFDNLLQRGCPLAFLKRRAVRKA